jgi:hypothetical protein
MKHPLIKEYLMKINGKGNPINSLTKSVKSANDFLKELSNSIESSPQMVN